MNATIISSLDESEKKSIFSMGKDKVCLAGEILFEQGEPANKMYLVNKGKVSLYRLMPNGDEKLFKVFMSGELIAEMAMFMEPRVYPMTARVEQETDLLVFNHIDVIDVFTLSPQTSLKVMHHMTNKIHQLMNTVNILTQVNANQRLVMKLAELYRVQLPSEYKVTLPFTKRLLATQLGMTPETLSRVIKKFKAEGYLVEIGNQFVILDLEGLCDSVDLTVDLFHTMPDSE